MRLNRATLGRPAYWLALSLAIAVVPLLTACGASSQPEPSTDEAAVINMPIENRATDLTRDDLRVSQGDTVRLRFTSDEPGEIHLHGYDLTADVSPEQPGELVFEATTAGAFGINFHVLPPDGAADYAPAGDGHSHDQPSVVVSETPIGVTITAEADSQGGVDVQIATEGFTFTPDLVDQPHTPGVGHAHIYVDGEKLDRVFDSHYHIDPLPPGEHEIRVSLNTNDHSELMFDGAKAESTVKVTVPDVGQATDNGEKSHEHDGHDHGDAREIIAEVHLGNLEVYP